MTDGKYATFISGMPPCFTETCSYKAVERLADNIIDEKVSFLKIFKKDVPHSVMTHQLVSESIPSVAWLCNKAYNMNSPLICPGIGAYTDSIPPFKKASTLLVLREAKERQHIHPEVYKTLMDWLYKAKEVGRGREQARIELQKREEELTSYNFMSKLLGEE